MAAPKTLWMLEYRGNGDDEWMFYDWYHSRSCARARVKARKEKHQGDEYRIIPYDRRENAK